MELRAVLETVPLTTDLPPALASTEIQGIAYDSRKVAPGFLFFAFPGAKTDGARFAEAAVKAGAVAVVSDRPHPAGFRAPWLQVPHGRQVLAVAARNFYGKPDERIAITAITGTNGKTTSTLLIDSVLRAVGKTTALVGTIEYHLAGRVVPAPNTTPESLDLLRMFHELEEAGGTHATIEASSHALDLRRIYALNVHTAGFTNFTRDHLDYHGTMEAYFEAKQLLFTPAFGAPPRFAVLNADDEGARKLRISPDSQIIWYSIDCGRPVGLPEKQMWLRAVEVESGFDGLRFSVSGVGDTPHIESKLVGRINVYNILLAYGVGLTYGLNSEQIEKGLRVLATVPGRFERVEEGQPFMVVVDYAHTDDALRNVISAARALKPKRVITLFGCGGDRDRSKRPLMGLAAGELSDYVVLTSDNPRSEDPLAIMNDAMVGLSRFDTPHIAEPDRERAIRAAISSAEPGDVVILAGKGHETYQILRDGPIPFDDREVARRVLRSFGYNRRA
jgi:UDP-N-acetylmuramoyl-L-alanyl-D-glutamate--2,6-diaminopimelate ligase